MSDYIIRAALRVTSGPYEGKKTMNNSQNEMVVLGPFVSCGENVLYGTDSLLHINW